MKINIALLLCLSPFLFLHGCDNPKLLRAGEGYLAVNGGKIWYRLRGDGNKTPVLMLHGGPAYASYYLNSLAPLGNDRMVITFDQLGCGQSDRITDTTLMTIENHVDQVKKLVDHLELKEFHLYGHSWGSQLAIDYYLKYPSGIKSLIMASPCLSASRWSSDSDSLISMLPDSVQTVLRNNIKGVEQDSSILASAVTTYWNTFYTRKLPTSSGFDSTVMMVGWNVYQYMWGPNDFFAIGTLKDYERTDQLKNIKVPTLYIGGDYDPARPSTLLYYQQFTANAKSIVIKNAGHVTMDDNNEDYLKALQSFFSEIDK